MRSNIPGISDHDTVFFSFNIEGIITNNARHYIYLYQKADIDGVSNYIENFLDSFTCTDPYINSVEQSQLFFKGAIHEALEKYVPKRQIKTSRRIPWITHTIEDEGKKQLCQLCQI